MFSNLTQNSNATNTRAGQSYNNKPFYAPFVNYKTALISDYGNEMSRVSNIYINVDRKLVVTSKELQSL